MNTKVLLKLFRSMLPKFFHKNVPIYNQKVLPSGFFCTSKPSERSDEENKLINVLKSKFPEASLIEVQDISGGCGAMYDISVESVEFKDLSRVKQHKLITQVS
ncbi:BolA-like protein 3 [Armadillidium vulgare]|nr:BolA-like protein 3 [Armadillidium vulgare]